MVAYERQIVLSSYNVAESTNRSDEILSSLLFAQMKRRVPRSGALKSSFDWIARSSLWHSASIDQLQCKGKSNGELLAYVSFRDRWQRNEKSNLFLDLPLCWLSLQRDYAIRVKNQVERVTNYLLTSPSKLLFSPNSPQSW